MTKCIIMYTPTKKCSSCDKRSPLLFKKCRHCKQYFSRNPSNLVDSKNKIVERIDNMSIIHAGLKYAEEAMTRISEDLIPYANKFRWLYLLVRNSTNGCQTCFAILKRFIDLGRCILDNNNQLHNVEQQLQELQELEADFGTMKVHIDSYNQTEAAPIGNFKIRRQYNQNNQQVDEYDDEYDDDYNNDIGSQTLGCYSATAEQISLITVIPDDKIPKGEDDLCVICLGNLYEDGDDYEPVIMLPCGHMFHDVCLMEWLKGRNYCPVGRCPIISLKQMIEKKMDK